MLDRTAELRAFIFSGGLVVENAWSADTIAARALRVSPGIASVRLWVQISDKRCMLTEYTRKPKHMKGIHAAGKGFGDL